MKKIGRRDVIRLSTGAVIYLYTPRILTGCSKPDERIIGGGDASSDPVTASDSAIALPDSAIALPDSAIALPNSAIALPDSAIALPNSGDDVLVISDQAFIKVAQVLDTLPNGFPATPEGLEIELLKNIFTEEEADLFCDLRLTFETAELIAERTGRPLDGLEEQLTSMSEKGLITGGKVDGVSFYRIKPWIVGVYESTMERMDRDLLQLADRYMISIGKQFFETQPQIMRVVPISETIPDLQQALPYHQVSSIIEQGAQFRVADCFCKRMQAIREQPCDKPVEVCMAIINVPNVEVIEQFGREISKEEAYQLLDRAEQAGLVHLTSNQQSGNQFICNCCGCCCGVLSGRNILGDSSLVVNSAYRAEIDPELCDSCGKCKNERCQVEAIEQVDDSYRVNEKRCIGCGLCVTACHLEAVRLVLKPEAEITPPPEDENAWNDLRAQNRGVDYSKYK